MRELSLIDCNHVSGGNELLIGAAAVAGLGAVSLGAGIVGYKIADFCSPVATTVGTIGGIGGGAIFGTLVGGPVGFVLGAGLGGLSGYVVSSTMFNMGSFMMGASLPSIALAAKFLL